MNINAIEKWIKAYRNSQTDIPKTIACDFCKSEFHDNEYFCYGCRKTIKKLAQQGLSEAVEYYSFFHQIDMNSDSLKTITKYYLPPERNIILDYLRNKLIERLSQ